MQNKLLCTVAKLIAKNSANINVVMRLMYVLVGGIIAQVTLSIGGLLKAKPRIFYKRYAKKKK